MKIDFKIALVGVVVLGLGVGAGFGAYESSSKQATTVAAEATSSGGSIPIAVQTDSRGSAQATGRPTTGVVEKVGEEEFSLKANSGSASTTVRVNDQTTISKQVTGSLSDLKQGERITVRGESGADGTIVAVSIQLVGAGGAGPQVQMGQMAVEGQPRGQRGQTGGQLGGGGAAQAGTGLVLGTVDSVAGNTVSITRMGGSDQNTTLKIAVSENTTITKTGTGDIKDVTEGASVLVIGPRGVDGVVVASSVQILPLEAGQMMRGRQ